MCGARISTRHSNNFMTCCLLKKTLSRCPPSASKSKHLEPLSHYSTSKTRSYNLPAATELIRTRWLVYPETGTHKVFPEFLQPRSGQSQDGVDWRCCSADDCLIGQFQLHVSHTYWDIWLPMDIFVKFEYFFELFELF